MTNHQEKIPVGISSCLLGERVRYDGGHKNHSYITKTLGEYFTFVSHCPEMAIGMGVPRPTIRLVDVNNESRAVGVKDSSMDVTEKLASNAREQLHWHQNLCGYILKKDSPSCGMERVKRYRNDHPEKIAVGIYAQQLMTQCPELPVEEEGRLGDARLRENFLQRVFIMHRWRKMCASSLTVNSLMQFHAQHKLIIMSRDQNAVRSLGRLIADVSAETVESVAQQYIVELMTTLKALATRGNQINVLQHIQGYLKQELSSDDKQELIETIELYRNELVPLIVPLTLLKHHFRNNPTPYIDSSYYMNPYPGELKLLNHI